MLKIHAAEHFTNATRRKYGWLGTSHGRDRNVEAVNRVLLNVTPAPFISSPYPLWVAIKHGAGTGRVGRVAGEKHSSGVS